MNTYELTLIFAEVLSIILAAIWIIYKLKEMKIDDLFINIATYLLFIYVAVGNLINQLTNKGDD